MVSMIISARVIEMIFGFIPNVVMVSTIIAVMSSRTTNMAKQNLDAL